MAVRHTIRSVAQETGVSVTTVSNVLNGWRQEMVAESLHGVLSAMGRLDYRPKPLGLELRHRPHGDQRTAASERRVAAVC